MINYKQDIKDLAFKLMQDLKDEIFDSDTFELEVSQPDNEVDYREYFIPDHIIEKAFDITCEYVTEAYTQNITEYEDVKEYISERTPYNIGKDILDD